MSRKEKLIKRLLTYPKDFTTQEMESLLQYLGYERELSGKTGGSRVSFTKDGKISIKYHNPHPGNELKKYQLQNIVDILRKEGEI